jgi:thiamine-phosphate pyrophosphorylase
MIVITKPTAAAKEINTIHALFENGLELLHIRKPNFSASEMNAFIALIALEFRPQLVLHSHHQLAEDLGVNRFHLTQKKRMEVSSSFLYEYILRGIRISTSTHSIQDFNQLGACFEYAFLSPVFPSISKANYQSEIDLFEAIKDRTQFSTQLIALGGITSENIKTTIARGFDCVAVLGSIWNTNKPVENFKLCQQAVHSF